jgi:bifunctional DNase/RNase
VHSVELTRILINETSDRQVIVLREKEGERTFPIIIGIYEAAAIDREIKGVALQRPLTHDLLKNVIENLGAKLERIVISDLKDNTFFATLVIQRNGATIEVDARPSDAIALAVRAQAPIYAEEKVITEASRWQT